MNFGMRKISVWFMASSFICGLFLVGCSLFGDAQAIDSLTFEKKIGEQGMPEYLEESLVVVPDYDQRVLNVNFVSKSGDFNGAGNVSGTFFDQFETIEKAYLKGELQLLTKNEENKGNCEESQMMNLIFKPVKGEATTLGFDICGNFSDELMITLSSFYDGVVELLTANAPV